MARINSNIPSLIAQSRLERTNADLSVRLERLSTGLRINRGKDDPAGLIISERLRSDIEGVNQGIRNAERASSVLATTEASLTEINDLLNSINSLVLEASNSGANSEEERRANQLQIDSAVESITRIANTASFGGMKLLDGSRDYTLSGIDTATIGKAKVHNASFTDNQPIDVEVDVLASAQRGALFFNGDIAPAPGQLASTVTLEIRGAEGVTTLRFASGTSLESVVNAVKNVSPVTGVTAELINGDPNSGIVFRSEGFGSNSFVSVERLDVPKPADLNGWHTYAFPDEAEYAPQAPFDWTELNGNPTSRDKGRDVVALVNGNLANGRGLEISVNSARLGLDLLLDESFATDPEADPTEFQILGGGAIFQLGPKINASQQVNIGVPSVAASSLGGTIVNDKLAYLSSITTGSGNSISESYQRNDFSAIRSIIEKSIDEISILRGRLGAFERNTLETNKRSLQSAFENLSASSSQIRDADFAFETSALTRSQILSSSGTTILGLANQQSQQVLQLLG